MAEVEYSCATYLRNQRFVRPDPAYIDQPVSVNSCSIVEFLTERTRKPGKQVFTISKLLGCRLPIPKPDDCRKVQSCSHFWLREGAPGILSCGLNPGQSSLHSQTGSTSKSVTWHKSVKTVGKLYIEPRQCWLDRLVEKEGYSGLSYPL